MKKVYLTTVSLYSTSIPETSAVASATPKARASYMRVSAAIILGIFLIFNGVKLNAQNCPVSGTTIVSANENTYYPGTQASVLAGTTSITLGAIGAGANFGNTPIAVGDILLIIQMQGAQINIPATATNAAYGGGTASGSGFLTTNLMAGKMEFIVATNAVPVGGGTLNISSGVVNNYAYSAFGANGQYTYQVIRVSTHFNIQLGGTITTPKWNGSTGGITVLSAVNQIDFNSKTVNALGAGFRGGGSTALGGAPGTNKNDFYTLSTQNANGGKAEGIAGTPRYVYFNGSLVDNVVEGYPSGSRGRGGPANGGGGATDSNPTANDQNSGGGGGGNGGAGGLGGNGWFSFGTTGGRGGTAFQTTGPIIYYSPSRLILGGGGGGGSNNNSSGAPGGGVASSGATGGGMVIINASAIIGTGTIDASGSLPNNTVTIDGSGGGGAGGSILVFANSGHAGVTAKANGSDGASNFPIGLSATQHGPGGGGGGGVIFSNAALNVASTVTAGVAGISTGTSATNSYGALAGTVGFMGITTFAQLPPNMQICQTIILPVTILNFTASYIANNNVKVSWSTTDEINADYFEVERSTDAKYFIGVEQVDANESLNPVHNYSINDQLFNMNSDIVYYRLRIVDRDGKYSYSKVIAIKLEQPENVLSVYPNPLIDYTTLSIYVTKPATGMIRLIDNAGKQLMNKSFNVYNGNNSVLVDQLGSLPRGIYVIQIMLNNKLYNQKIVKK
jgi:hypothetical protein